MKLAFKISLSIKIAILTGITFMLLFEFLISFFKNKNIDDFKRYSQSRLVENAKLIAANIDGDDHRKAIMIDDSAKIYYTKIQNILNKSKISLGIKEEIASIFLHNESTSCYGVMSNVDTIARQGCSFRDTSLKFVFKESFKKNKPISSDIYSDRDGTWLSGFAPIIDKKGNVVAVLELDLSFNEYNDKLKEFTSWTIYFRIFGIIISIIIGILLGLFIGKPLSNLSKKMSLLANEEKAEEYKVPILKKIFPDESTSLIHSFNYMSSKLSKLLFELHKANEQLKELDKSKSVFLSLISHELRTPLTGLGFIDLLHRDNSFNQDDFELIENIRDSYLRIKDFSLSAENYIKALNYRAMIEDKTNLFFVITEILQNVRLKYTREITLQDFVEDIVIYFNDFIFEEILTKVIENAIKYSEQTAEIVVKLKIIDDYFIKIYIIDKGIGIKFENLHKIFEPYFVNDIDSHSQGSGVSLAICKAYINKYDGDISVHSDGMNQGSTFVIKLKRVNTGN